jgi:DNA-binding transcriptional MerR regulator
MKMEHQSGPQIPDKLYFKIGEVSAIAGLPTYVLRFWETQFTKINPKRTSSGQRLYRKNDVEVILRIKSLLHEKKFTIQGAVQHLKTNSSVKKGPTSTHTLKEIRLELERLRNILDN